MCSSDLPSRGSTILVNIGCTANSKNALKKSVAVYAGSTTLLPRADSFPVMLFTPPRFVLAL